MATEDFSAYTEVDPNGKLTVTSTKITAVDLDRDEDAYVYKDFGASNFNKLNIDFECRIESTSVNTSVASIGMTAATVDDSNNWAVNDFRISITRQDPNYNIFLVEGDGSESDSLLINADTLYYVTISRAAGGTALNVAFYTDAARTSQVGATMTITISSATRYRYVYGIASFNDASGGLNLDGFVQNMIINQFIPQVTIY